ncbi:MAG: CoA transferase [Dehalococcoidia bacterium]|nr:CoA transferase [Dehalococcoidia bacterium]
MPAQYLPLTGVRILSIETAASLPAGTRTLADLGADVVRVAEPAGRVNPYIRVFDTSLMNKQSIGIDLKDGKGRGLARRLARQADVVACNYRPHVLDQFGLDYQSLRALKPDVIALLLTGYGTPGPWAEIPAFGPNVEAAGGMNALTGDADEPPQRIGGGVFADTMAGRYCALAILGALDHRERTGEGQYVEVSMYECIARGLGELVLSAASSGQAPRRTGSRSDRFAPQGIYPALGEDEWLALSVTTDDGWAALVELVGDSRLAGSGLLTAGQRHDRHGEIDELLSAWTSRQEKLAAATALQERGIPAGPVQKTSDVALDEHHRAREFFQRMRHETSILGHTNHPHMRLATVFGGYERTSLTGHRDEGGDAEDILRRWLGSSDDAIEGLRAEGAFLVPRAVVPPDTPVPDWFGGRDSPDGSDFAQRLGLEASGDGV